MLSTCYLFTSIKLRTYKGVSESSFLVNALEHEFMKDVSRKMAAHCRDFNNIWASTYLVNKIRTSVCGEQKAVFEYYNLNYSQLKFNGREITEQYCI